MEFVLGLLAAVVFFVVYQLGKWQGNKVKPHIAPTPLTDDEAAEREQQVEKAKQIQKHFQSLMDYDVDKALERKY